MHLFRGAGGGGGGGSTSALETFVWNLDDHRQSLYYMYGTKHNQTW